MLRARITGLPSSINCSVKYRFLSNEDASQSLLRLLNEGCQNFLLAHLSKENNRPEIAYLQAVGMLKNIDAVVDNDYRLRVAEPLNTNCECLAF